MTEYKVLKVRVNRAEEALNRLADEGWRVVSTSVLSGLSLTTGTAPMVVTLERKS